MALTMNSDEKKSAGITAGIVTILCLLFLFVGLTLELPLPSGEMEISFGTSMEGSGEIQPQEFTSQEVTDQQTEVAESSQSTASEASDMTSEDNIVEAPESDNTNSTSEVINESDKEDEKEVDKETEMLNDLYQNSSSSNQSEGLTNNEGDQGDPNGSDNTNHQPGGWDGDSFFPVGPVRGKTTIPTERDANCQEKGKVAVIIYINRNGEVVGEPEYTSDGTTNTAPCLVERAIKFAKGIKYKADSEAPALQKVKHICNFELN